MSEPLTEEQEKQCKNAVRKFLNDSSMELHVDADMRQVQLCFKFLKQAVLLQQKQKLKAREISENRKETLRCEQLQEREEIIGILRSNPWHFALASALFLFVTFFNL